jgi:hypothetical protein
VSTVTRNTPVIDEIHPTNQGSAGRTDRESDDFSVKKVKGPRVTWLYRQLHLVHYSQVMMLATHADGSNMPDSYPEYKTGEERLIHSANGIVVTTATNVNVDLRVCDEALLVPASYNALPTVEIDVPHGAIVLGNEMTSSKGTLKLTAGRYQVATFVDKEDSSQVTSVCFVLNQLT